MDGRVEALCSSSKKGMPKNERPDARFEVNLGMVGDAHAGPGHRQISLLGAGDVEKFKRLSGLPLAAGAFAENVLVSGIDLRSLGLGSQLRLGSDVVLTITQLGKICHNRCAIYFHAGDCIMPRRGVFARVLAGGTVAVQDPASIEHLVPRALAQAVVITVSDRCSRGETEDTAGPAVAEALIASRFCHVYAREIVADDREGIAARLKHYCDGHSIDLVVAVGGTGFAPRDVTPEAVRDVVDRLTPGLDEAMRATSRTKTTHAMLSRAASGIRHSTLVVSLPGSRNAALENLEAILPALEHGLAKLRGDPSDCGRPRQP
jgi:molybdenum cofactor synthesis domain-containing protein